MNELIRALEIRRHYNQMDFYQFVKEYEEWSGEKIDIDELRDWNFMGLNNVDFLLSKIK